MRKTNREIIVTRKFGLDPRKNSAPIPKEIFSRFQSCVSLMIRHGIWLNASHFEGEGLVGVSKFYNFLLQKPELHKKLSKMGIRERLRRCAAQPAYFMIREQKRRAEILRAMATLLLRKGEYVSILRNSTLPKAYYEELKHHLPYPSSQSYVFFDNIFRHLRNLLKDGLKGTITLDTNSLPSNSENCIEDFTRFSQLHLKRFRTTLSRILGKRIKTIAKGNGPPYGAGKFDSILDALFPHSRPTPRAWKKIRDKWRTSFLATLQIHLHTIDTEELFANANSTFRNRMDVSHLVNTFFRKQKTHSYIQSADNNGFLEYLSERIVLEQERHYLESKRIELERELQTLLSCISRKPLEFLGKPQFKASSIPLGPDDGQVYSLTLECDDEADSIKQVTVCLSFQSRVTHEFLLKDTERFSKLIADGYSPKKGTITKSLGKGLVLAIPFSKEAPSNGTYVSPKKDAVEVVASVDLGLKTLATVSINEIPRNVDTFTREDVRELARYFIDQEQLLGSKEEWLTRKKCIPLVGYQNIKRHLLNLRAQARHLQKKKDHYKNRHKTEYRHKITYRILNTQWKYAWRKIQHIHEELANQVATRIVAAALHNKASIIKVEDLSWSKPRSKQQVGYFLSTWQVHWFFSKIQSQIECIARRFGIHVVYINAYNTSQRCSRCGVVGHRVKKRFSCPQCGFSLDSDLNAAREIAIANLSSIAICGGGGSPLPSPS